MDQSFLSLAMSLKDIKKTEIILPISRKNALVTPLLLGDHTVLKTTLSSPQNYDREMIKCLHKHTTILDNGKEKKYTFDELVQQISNIDKLYLIWACYKTTYEDLGLREVVCDKCKEKHNYKIIIDDLIQEDTITLWEEEDIEFYKYTYPIEIAYENYTYTFETSIPTIQKHNQVLGTLSINKIKANLEAETVLSPAEELAVLVKSISIKKDDVEIAKTNTLHEILATMEHALPSIVFEKLIEKYRERFDRYEPKFYTMLHCPKCENDIKYDVDIETEFFRRILFGRGSIK